MTPDPMSARFADEPQLRELHAQMQAPAGADAAGAGAGDVDPTGAALTELLDGEMFDGEMFDSDVRAYVDALLAPGEAPSPEMRQRMTRAAVRGLAYQRKRSRPAALPVLLADRRGELDLPVAEVAAALGVEEAKMLAFEAGNVDLRDVGAERITAWVTTLGVAAAAALPSLRRALEATAPSATRLAAGAPRQAGLSADDEALVAAVAERLPG